MKKLTENMDLMDMAFVICKLKGIDPNKAKNFANEMYNLKIRRN